MRRYQKTLVAIFSLLFTHSCIAQDYGKTMSDAVKRALGKSSTKDFKFASYPVDNFGVLTSYDGHNTELCATWTCVADDDQIPNDPKKLLDITTTANVRYVDVGTGAPLTLTDEVKKTLGIQVVLPQLLKVIGINVNVGTNSDVSSTLDIGPVTKRTIIPDKYIDRINSLPSSSSVRAAFDAKQLKVVYQDIVVSKMTVTLTVTKGLNTDADAKLSGQLDGKVGQVIGGSGSELSVKVDSSGQGKYVITVTQPVILATLTKRQPSAGHLGPSDLKTWTTDAVSTSKFTVQP